MSAGANDNSTAILIQFKDHTSAASGAEGESSSNQDIASESSEEPVPDAETVARALAFLKAKQEETAEGSKSS